MGLDVLGVYIAFKVNFRAARAYEDVEVTTVELLLAKVDPEGAAGGMALQPVLGPARAEGTISSSARRGSISWREETRVEVASFLGPDAKQRFADDLARALAQARRGFRYS